jgi:hypothetical protein
MTSETPDVVSRLLAKIAEVEQGYRDNQEALDLATSYEVAVGSNEYLRSTIADGLRLCQAHREIVAAYEAAQVRIDRFPFDDRAKFPGAFHSYRGYALGLRKAVVLVAGGYGIQEDPDD